MRYIIAGAPCSGKSTYVKRNYKVGDLIYDYDALHGALSGQLSHHHLAEIRPYVLTARDAVFDTLEANEEQRAWIVTSTRKQAELEALRDRFKAEIILLEITREEAHKRCALDGRPEAWHGYIDHWFDNADIELSEIKSVEVKMAKKKFASEVQFKDTNTGEFTAVFSRLNVIDKDGDITLPGAFMEGAKVRISYWGHRWQDLPVGKGAIHSDQEKAWVDGEFFLDTEAGKETYKTVKNLSELQEWSYGFDILDSEMGEADGETVQYLKKLEVFEISPVLLGAGIGTGTVAIKEQSELMAEQPTEVEDEVDEDKSSGGLSVEDYKNIFERLFDLGGL